MPYSYSYMLDSDAVHNKYRQHTRQVSVMQTYNTNVFGCCNGYQTCGANLGECCRKNIRVGYLLQKKYPMILQLYVIRLAQMEATAADLIHVTVFLAGLEMHVKQVWDNFNTTNKQESIMRRVRS